MSARAMRKAISVTPNRRINQQGVSAVTVAVMLAALATVALTIVHAAAPAM